MRKITPLFGIAFEQTCTSYRTRLRECLVFLVHRIYASYCEEANVQDIYILDKMRVFFVEMYYVNSFKDIIYKKKRKKGKSTIQMF